MRNQATALKAQQVREIYLVIAVPGSGKTWVCEQLRGPFYYVAHDDYMGSPKNREYVAAILERAETSTKPVLAEATYSISEIKDPLKMAGFTVVPIFIVEEVDVILERYRKREGNKPYPKQHLSRRRTYQERCKAWGAFSGTSAQVLAHLKSLGCNDE